MEQQRNFIINQMNKIVQKANGQFNSHLYMEYCYWESELEKIDNPK